MPKRSKEVVSYNMSQIKSKGTKLETQMEVLLRGLNIEYEIQPDVYGKPDFTIPKYNIAVFADSDFWHGFNWEVKKKEFKTNRDFWINKIERNMERDREVTKHLEENGWTVLRFWGHEIYNNPNICIDSINIVIKKHRNN